MDAAEYGFASVIGVVLAILAVHFARRQWQAMHDLGLHDDLTAEDRRYYRGQAVRRWLSCALMMVLAILLVGWYWLGFERSTRQLLAERAQTAAGAAAPFWNPYSIFWTTFSAVFLLWVGLAFLDIWAIRRFGRRHYRQIKADRQAMIEQQLARLRQQREHDD